MCLSFIVKVRGDFNITEFSCHREPEDNSFCVVESFLHPDACNKFIQCNSTCHVTESTYVFYTENGCTRNLHFSNVTENCTLSEEANCQLNTSIKL